MGDRGLLNDELGCLKCLEQPANPVVEPLNGALNFVHFAVLKVGFTALVTDPGRDCVEYEVISVAVNMEGRFRAIHLPMTVDAGHWDLLSGRALWRTAASAESALAIVPRDF